MKTIFGVSSATPLSKPNTYNLGGKEWEVEDHTIAIPDEYLKGHKSDGFFVLKVKGDSMYPAYQEGDTVLVLKQSTLNYSGQVGVILYLNARLFEHREAIILSRPIGMQLQKCFIGCVDAKVRIAVLVFRVIHHFNASVFHKDFHTCFDFLAVLIKILHGTFLLSDIFTHPH